MDAFNRNNKEMKLSTVSAIGTAMTALVTPALLAVSVAGVALATSAQEAKSRSYGLNVNGLCTASQATAFVLVTASTPSEATSNYLSKITCETKH